MRVLAVNVGNSRYQAGLWEDGEVVRAGAAERVSAAMLREVAGGAALDGVARARYSSRQRC